VVGHLFFIVLYGQPDKAAEKTPGDPVGKNPDDNATAALRFGVVQSEKGNPIYLYKYLLFLPRNIFLYQ